MEMNQENSPDKQEDDLSESENLHFALNELSKLKKSLSNEIEDPEAIKSWKFLKKFDLAKVLNAIVYKAKFDNKLCDIKMVMSHVKNGFEQLICIQPSCSEKAYMLIKQDEDTPAELYCKKHSNMIDPFKKGQHRVDYKQK